MLMRNCHGPWNPSENGCYSGQRKFQRNQWLRTREDSLDLIALGYDAEIGGTHEEGIAADLIPEGTTLDQLAGLLSNLVFAIEDMNRAENHVHVECRQQRDYKNYWPIPRPLKRR